jgi:hypothetical protein
VIKKMAVFLTWAAACMAADPVITVTGPTGTIFVSSFPYSAPITFAVYNGPSTDNAATNAELKNLNVLEVSVNGTQIFGTAGNPFDNDNACTSQMSLPTVLNCSVLNANNATITVPWSIPAPGTYLIAVTVKNRGDEGEGTGTLNVNLLSVEYPAPPAIANQYINEVSALKSAAPKIRGCVLNEIAREHGQNQKYGPAPGPYNNLLVKQDVKVFWTSPCNGTWPATVPAP